MIRRPPPAEKPKIRVIGYVRVSTERQADEGYSLEAQTERIAAYAVAQRYDLVGIEKDDGYSAKSLDRPALQRAFARLKKGEAAGLVVAKLDRLTRSIRDLAGLVEDRFSEGGWSLISVADNVDTLTPNGKLFLHLIGSIGQWERETIGARTRETKRFMREKGLFLGGDAPYGYERAPGGLAEVAAEQAVMREAAKHRKRGAPFHKIADALNKKGHRSRVGHPFVAMQVMRMLGGVARKGPPKRRKPREIARELGE